MTTTSRTRTYKIWAQMKSRCKGSATSYRRLYAGRGIRVCERWQKFSNFLADMGHPPDGYSIDRIDGAGNYEPGNCRWASRIEQNNNTARNRVVEYDGRKQTVAQWAKELGVDSQRLRNRLRRGWSVSDTLTRSISGHGAKQTVELVLRGQHEH